MEQPEPEDPSPEEAPPEVVKVYDPAEIKKLARSTSRDLEMTEFVHWNEIDPAYLDTSYYVVPDPGAQKPYSLLYAAMKETSFAALAQIVMHGREQVLVLGYGGKGLVAHTMFYFSEVRRDQEAPADTKGLSAKDLQLAATLIQHMAGPFEPERYADPYKQREQALVEAQAQKAAERKAPQTQTAPAASRSKRKSA